jgi:hypothetical protein
MRGLYLDAPAYDIGGFFCGFGIVWKDIEHSILALNTIETTKLAIASSMEHFPTPGQGCGFHTTE